MNEIVSIQPREVSLNQVQIAQNMGEIAYKSGIYKAPTPEASAMIMLKGFELGFPMTASAEFIVLIEGTVGLNPRGALAIMRSRPDVIKSVTLTDLEKDGKYFGCRCDIVRYENGQEVKYSKSFDLDKARQADLIKPKSGWEKYPEQMCQWRALGFCADIACPDLLAGMTGIMKMPEIIDDQQIVSFADNDIGSSVVVEPVKEDEPKTADWNLQKLIDKFSAEKILAVNNGMMPGSNEDCRRIAEMLEGNK